MVKLLIIVALAVYIIMKIGSWFFRAGAASQQFRSQGPTNANMNSRSASDKKKGTNFKGGDYVDYEEVK
jgi:hypothetical protein